ncbi:hypothetical protein BGW80DRAFT_1251755 [Lactifluus volemus]|nr:hypothetical protein BGW80DRAFT_1251755 [Lactifluus volemus]
MVYSATWITERMWQEKCIGLTRAAIAELGSAHESALVDLTFGARGCHCHPSLPQYHGEKPATVGGCHGGLSVFNWTRNILSAKIGGRPTAIKLAYCDVWVLASTPLTPETKTAVDCVGPVKFVVGPNAVPSFLGALWDYGEAEAINLVNLLSRGRTLPNWDSEYREARYFTTCQREKKRTIPQAGV